MKLRLLVQAALLAHAVDAHAVLTSPAPRPASGMQGTGAKLQPFASALSLANGGCGGTTNGDPGVRVPTQAFTPGQAITVTWDLTIPHPNDNLDTGVRVAMHFGAGDSFDDNVLEGGVEGSGNPGTLSAGLETVTVTLPNKLCDYCTLQWIWAARADGGSYIGCADIAITTAGTLPNYALLPSQEGNVLPGVRASAAGPGAIVAPSNGDGPDVPGPRPGTPAGNSTDGGGGNGATVAIVIVSILIVLGAGFYFCYWRPRRQAAATPKEFTGTGTVPPPPPPPAEGQEMLPPGWSRAFDPASGRPYYINANTMQSSWTPPGATTGV